VGDDAAREKGSQVLRDAVAEPAESSGEGHDIDLQRAAAVLVSADRQGSIQSAFTHTPSVQSTTSESFPFPPHTPVTSSRKRHRHAAESNLPSYPAAESNLPSYPATESDLPSYPAPVTSTRKRHRYAAESNLPSYPAVESNLPSYLAAESSLPSYPAAESSLPSYTAGDYMPYSVPYGSHPGYRSNRQRLEQYPSDYGYSHPQPSRVASSTPPQASIQGAIQGGARITANSEFDLFNCELLESDHEDQAEKFPPPPPESHEDTF
jgi:hypothetical protein